MKVTSGNNAENDQECESQQSIDGAAKKQGMAVRILLMIFWRFFLVIFTAVILVIAGLCMILALVFNGPSKTARNVLTMSLTEASATKWIPALFLGEELVQDIRASVAVELPVELIDDVTDTSMITIQTASVVSGSDEWQDYPDGIRIVNVSGDTYNAYAMIIRDPSRVYVSVSSKNFSIDVPGKRINNQIEYEGASAAINGGAFFDDATAAPTIGSIPLGLVYSKGRCAWDDKTSYNGFAGFTQDNILVVAKEMKKEDAEELNIRDGCCFGPILIMNGEINEEAYNNNSGYNPRTCIGQRKDGAVIFVCVDGRQAGSLGASYSDLIDIMVEMEAVNACNMDGGASSLMLYRDTCGRYGDPGKVQMINQYSLLQQAPRKMPTFFMVRPMEQEEQ